MKKLEGVLGTEPKITKITFSVKGKMDIHLKDGRIIMVPLDFFEEIKKLSPEQRKKWSVIGGEGFTFDACSEVYHLEQVMGSYKDYKYSFVIEFGKTYLKRKK